MLVISAGRGRGRRAEGGGGTKPHFPSKSALRRLWHLQRAGEAHRCRGRAADRHLLPRTPCFVHVEVSGDANLVHQGSGTPRLYWALQRRAHVVQKHEMTERGRTEVQLNHRQSCSTFRRLRWRRNGANRRHRRLGQLSRDRAQKEGLEHKRKGSSSPGRFKAAQRGSCGPGRPRARQPGLGGVWGVFGGGGASHPRRGGLGHVAGPGSNEGFMHHTVVTGMRCTARGRQGRFWAHRRRQTHCRAWLKRRAHALRRFPRNPLTKLSSPISPPTQPPAIQ